MAATLTQERFTGPDWVFERKFDGIRLLAFKRSDEVRLLSRNQLPQHVPAISEAIGAMSPRHRAGSIPASDRCLSGLKAPHPVQPVGYLLLFQGN